MAPASPDRCFSRLTAVEPGFDPSRVLSLKVFLTPPRYRSISSEKQYLQSALDRLSSIAGVETAAAVSQLPMGDPASGQPFDIDGSTFPVGDRLSAAYRAVSASYFAKLRIPVVRGRGLTVDDREDAPLVVVVNDALARRFFGAEDPVGRRIKWASGLPQFDRAWHTIVGVAADVKSAGLDKLESPAIYEPFTQRRFPSLRWNSFVVRTHGAPNRSRARSARRS